MASETIPHPNRFELRRRQNRAALLDAALTLFQEQGLRGTKIDQICARADVAPRTFFNHFETREHLYAAIAEQRATQLAAAFDATGAGDAPFAERLADLFAGAGRYVGARPLYRELVAEMLNLRPGGGSEIARGRTIGRAARRFVENAMTRGEVARRHPPEVLGDLLVGALTTALANWCASEDFDLEAELARASRALSDLFTPDP